MKKGFRLLLRLTVFISFFLLADYLFSTSLFNSTSFDDEATEYIDTTTSQEWEEMGVLPKDYLKLHQLSTGAGSVPDQNDQEEEEEEEREEEEEEEGGEEQMNVNSYIGSKKKFMNSDRALVEDQESLTKSVAEENKGLKKITGATNGETEQSRDSLKKDGVEKEGEEGGNDVKKSNSETIESKDTIAKLQEKNSQSAKSRTILSKEEATSPSALEVLSKISKDGEKVSSDEASDQSELLVKDAEVQTKDAVAVNSKNSKVALKSVDSATADNEEPIMETSGQKKRLGHFRHF